MNDLISRQAAIDAITQYLGRIKRDFKQWKGTARIILDHVPSARPLVIHCTNCKDWLERQSILGFTISELPSARPDERWNRLMMYLADLQLAYSPRWGANGCGDQKLYDFVTELIDELEGW